MSLGSQNHRDAAGSLHGQAGTFIVDRFDYTSPLGPLGTLADLLFLKRYMRRLLTKRNGIIKQVAESGRVEPFLEGPNS